MARCAAVITAHLEQPLVGIREIEARDPRIALGLRYLAEDAQSSKPRDLFIVGSVN